MRASLVILLSGLNVGSLVGAVLLYSDATGQRPVHNQAVIAILLLWVPLAFIVSACWELLARG